MSRPGLNSKTPLWLLAIVAAFFVGAEWNRRFQQPVFVKGPRVDGGAASLDTLKMPDGTTWFRVVYDGQPQGRVTLPGENGETITITPPLTAE